MPRPLTHSLPLSLRAALSALVLVCGLSVVGCRPTQTPPIALATPTFGPADSAVELLAFVDFECPFSRAQAAILTDLLARYPAQLHVRVLHLPLDLHAHSVLAARAAVAAEQQGAFPAFWQKWLRPEATLSRDALIAWAVEAKLDAPRFAADLDTEATKRRVARDVAIGRALGLTGTPSLLINGSLLQGKQSLAALAALVDREVRESATIRAAGGQTDKLVHARVLQNAPQLAPSYQRYIEQAQPAPPQPVPVVTGLVRQSEVADAQLRPAPLETGFGGQRALVLAEPVSPSDATVWRVVVRADDPQIGAVDAPVTLVLFLDVFAQETIAALPSLLRLAMAPDSQTRLVFKHLPRPVHPLAQLTAEALEAAREQAKFVPLLQALAGASQPLTQAAVLQLAKTVGLDPPRFNTSLAAHSGKARIDADLEQANALGVTGFAALYGNGVRIAALTEAEVVSAVANLQKRVSALPQPARSYAALTAQGKLLDALDPTTHTFDLSHAALQGLPGAAIEIVVFGDLQCPYTARLWPHLQQLDTEMPGRLRVAWLDWPQTTVHARAEMLAEAGQEARRQGRFWPFVTALARRVDVLDDRTLWLAAAEVGLKEKALKQALAQHTWTQAVQAERDQGERAGVKATPTVFIDGHLFQPANGISADSLRPAIRQLLATH